MASFGWNIVNGVLRLTIPFSIPNNTYETARNAAGTADVNMWKLNTASQIETDSGVLMGGGASVAAGSFFSFATRGFFDTLANACFRIQNAAGTIGSILKVDALPTISSGFGTTPAITAGSTPFAGSVNVGAGGVATSGVINFGGTAFPSAPFVVAMNTTTGAILKATATTTQLTITANAAFTASDVVAWICVGARA